MAEEKESSNGGGDVSIRDALLAAEEVHANGFAIASQYGGLGDGNSAGSSRDGLKTYTRRKRARTTVEDGKFAWASTSQVADESIKELRDKAVSKSSCTQASFTEKELLSHLSDNDGCSIEHWRNVVLDQMSQTFKGEGGLQRCTKDALVLHPESCLTNQVKESVHSCEDGSKCTSQTDPTINGGHSSAVSADVGVKSNGSMRETKSQKVTELCKRTFSDVIMSEKFTQLCHLLIKSFPGTRAEKVFDFSLVNSRMKEGAYQISPDLFLTDFHQVWTNIHKIGMDMVALAKCLSDKSRTSYHEQAGSLLNSSFEGKPYFFTQESDMHAKEDRAEACAVYMVCTCRHCGEKADGRSCLVCDSCEEMYHMSCIEPAVKQIPLRSWYCASCTAKGIGSPHDECVVCERLNAPKSPNFGGVGDEFTNEKMVMELEESSNGLVDDELQRVSDGEVLPTCNACRTVVENGENLKICRHTFCPHKFYHVRCLTKKQLNTYGSCWYCPSCLCRSCLTDRDDDKIVMCDGCDHAYHIYCMQPPRTSIPRGKWFCIKCEADLRRIHKAKKSYEQRQHKFKRRGVEGKESHAYLHTEQKDNDREALDKSGGMEMLLSAAKTLNYQENLAAAAALECKS